MLALELMNAEIDPAELFRELRQEGRASSAFVPIGEQVASG
jgi:hypothetical protein